MNTFEDICRRAGGRRRYNAYRKAVKEKRFQAVSELWELYTRQHGRYKRGLQAGIARELGVSRTTIARRLVFAREFCREAFPKRRELLGLKNRS